MLRPILRHCLTALYPPVDGLPGIGETEGLDAFLRKSLSEVPWLMWWGLVGGAAVFVLTPVVTVYWPVPSFLLPADTLDRHADRIATHRVYTFRQAIFLVKMLAGLHYGANPGIRADWHLPAYPPDPDSWRTS